MQRWSRKTDFKIPGLNYTGNVYIMEVIGGKLDNELGDSLYSHAYRSDKDMHSPQLCYPTGAFGVSFSSGSAAPWDLGVLTPFIPAGTILSPFDIHYISIEDLSANTTYELHLFWGDSDTFAGEVRFVKNAIQDGTVNAPFKTDMIPAGEKITGRLMTGTGNEDTAIVAAHYHIY